jgi:hypothetical protein
VSQFPVVKQLVTSGLAVIRWELETQTPTTLNERIGDLATTEFATDDFRIADNAEVMVRD